MESFNATDKKIFATFATMEDAKIWAKNFLLGWYCFDREELEVMAERISRWVWDKCGDPGENGQKYMYDDHPWGQLSRDDVWALSEGVGKFKDVVAKFPTVEDAKIWAKNFLLAAIPSPTEEMISRVARYTWAECKWGEPGENGEMVLYYDHPLLNLTPEEIRDLADGVGDFSYMK